MIAFDGTQPTFRQSPPSSSRSISATFAPERRRRVRRDQSRRPAADDHQVVAVRGLRIAPSGGVHVLQPLVLVAPGMASSAA